jgi:hypothetical protein
MSRTGMNISMLRNVTILISFLVGLLPYVAIYAKEDGVNGASDDKIIFLFVTKAADEKARNGIEEWHQLFANNLQTFLYHAAEPDTKLRVFLQHSIVENPVDEPYLEAYWRSAHTLEAIGAVGTQAGKITTIDNQVYIGDLKGLLRNALLHVTEPIIPAHFMMSRDAVAIIMLYTISMDIAASRDKREACKPLSMARLYATDLRGKTAEELGDLTEAVQKDLDAWHCKGQK